MPVGVLAWEAFEVDKLHAYSLCVDGGDPWIPEGGLDEAVGLVVVKLVATLRDLDTHVSSFVTTAPPS